MVYFGGFFAKLGRFGGFSLRIIKFVARINEAAMQGVGDIIFHNLGSPVEGYTLILWFFGVSFYSIRRKDQQHGWGVGWSSWDII